MAEEATETPTPTQGEDQSQPSQAPSQETSATQTAEPEYFSENFDPSTLDESLQPAYKQMQGAWTKKTQELAEQRKQHESQVALASALQSDDPSERQHAVKWLNENGLLTDELLSEALGYQFEQDEETEQSDEETGGLDPQLEQRLSFLEAQEQQRLQELQAAELDQRFQTESAGIEKELGIELSEEDWTPIVEHALAVATATNQEPDLKAAFDRFHGFHTAAQKSWASSKETTHTAAGGAAATEVPDLANMSRAERHQWLKERAAEVTGEPGPS